MKIYLAATIQNDFRAGSQAYLRLDSREREVIDSIKYRLDSYHYIGNQRLADRVRSTGYKIFLDSGAFSAFTQGITVDIRTYCDYIRRNQDFIEVASVLDAIGDPDQTWRNQQTMEQLGVSALPCFHYGEPPAVLQWYIDHYEYITIGGMVPISSPQLQLWLDRIWGKYLTHPDGRPKLKVHGFGMTSVPLMARYPWYSVDSSSWVQLGGMGNIFITKWGMVAISEHSPNVKADGKHLDSLPEIQKQGILDEIIRLGFDPDRLRREHLSRKTFNALTYSSIESEDGYTTKRFKPLQPVLF